MSNEPFLFVVRVTKLAVMKRMVIELFALLLFVLSTITSCRKEHKFMNEGVIVGWNYGFCSTCGGFYLNLSNDTVINANTYYVLNYSKALTSVIAQYANQFNKNHLPINVYVDWLSIPIGQSNWIRVTDIRTR
jgi:hypothetical protein